MGGLANHGIAGAVVYSVETKTLGDADNVVAGGSFLAGTARYCCQGVKVLPYSLGFKISKG